MKITKVVFRAIAALGCLLAADGARAQEIVPTGALYSPAGALVGFTTTEKGLSFLIPARWSLAADAQPAARLTAEGDVYDLRLVLRPDYSHAAATVAAIRRDDPAALFFPLPMTITRVSLFLPGALGQVEAELTPSEDGFSTPVALYYRLRFDGAQLQALRTLANGGVTLQGAVEYAYQGVTGIADSAAPLTVILRQADLEASTAAAPDPTAWLAELLAVNAMRIPAALDGDYALGGGVTVRVTKSVVTGRFLAGAWALTETGNGVVRIDPVAPSNLAGQVSFYVPALGFTALVDYQASLVGTLDLNLMRFDVSTLDVVGVTVNGTSSPFYKALLGKLMRSPRALAALSDKLGEELQRRILSETLFGLEGDLP